MVRALSFQSWTYHGYVTPLCCNLLWFCWLPMISSCVESKSDSIERLSSHMYALAWTSTLSEYGSCIIFDTKALIGGAVTTQRGIPLPPLIYQGRQRVKCLTLRRPATGQAYLLCDSSWGVVCCAGTCDCMSQNTSTFCSKVIQTIFGSKALLTLVWGSPREAREEPAGRPVGPGNPGLARPLSLMYPTLALDSQHASPSYK